MKHISTPVFIIVSLFFLTACEDYKRLQQRMEKTCQSVGWKHFRNNYCYKEVPCESFLENEIVVKDGKCYVRTGSAL